VLATAAAKANITYSLPFAPYKTLVARPVLFFLACLVLAACAQPGPRPGVGMNRVDVPPWARTGVHPEYPAQTHLLGFGSAAAKDAAESAATARLEQAIVAHALAQDGGMLQGTQFASLVTERAAWFTLGEFEDSVRRDLAGNGFEFVALRAIHKGDLRLRAAGMLADARAALAGAPDPNTAGDLRSRVQTAARAFVLAARVLALRLLAEGAVDKPALAAAEDAALAIWELPGLVRLEQGGAGQKAAFGGGLARPLTLKARFRGTDLANIPLLWSLPPGLRGVVQGDAATDAAGRATCTVLQVVPGGDPFGLVRCQMDLNQMTPQPTGIAVPVWAWQFTLPCRHNVELVVNVEEVVDDKKTGFERYFVPGLQQWATRRNLTIELARASERPSEYRLRLEGSLSVSTWLEGEVPKARTGGKLKLVDHADGRVLFEYVPGLLREGRPGNTADSLALVTLREAATDALSEVCARLLVLAPAPGEEFGRGK
jgi:hypothetical protein